MATVHNNDLFW